MTPAPTEFDADIAKRVSAYPGTLTFMDLIRRNKRQSVELMFVMVVLSLGVGVLLAAGLAAYSGGVTDLPSLVPSMILGGLVALVVATVGSVWSWFGGSAAILMMSGAREIRKQDDPQLFNVVDELRIAAGVPMPRVFLINDSALNAFATGRDPARGVVAITAGLRERLNRDELQGVLAHEMAHIRHYDIRFAMLMATLVGLIAFACDGFRRFAFYGWRGSKRTSDAAKGGGAITLVFILIAVVLSILAPLLAVLIQLAMSRQREYLADAGAVELTRNPLALASALRKLADDTDPLVDTANRATAHLFIVNPLRRMRESGQSINSPFCSHPPVKERIARLMALAR